MKKVLLVTYGGGHVPMIVSLLKELRRRGDWSPEILALTTARPVLRAAGIPSYGFKDLVEPGDAEALALGVELARTHHQDGVGIDYDESVAYLGLSSADLRARLGVEEAARQFTALGRAAFLPLGPVERLFRRVRPELVVATSSPRSEAAAIRLARTRGLPALCLCDFVAPEMIRTDWIAPFLVEPDYADLLTVVTEPVRDQFIRLGRRPKDVVVTGNPAFDPLADPVHRRRAEAWRRERGLEGKKVVLFASQPEPGNEALPGRILEACVRSVEGRPDWHLVHRRHPSEAFPSTPPPRGTSRSDSMEPLETVLAAIDVVVTCTSTLGFQAVLMDKPMVKVCLSAWDRHVPYDTMGVAVAAWTLEDLRGALELALSDSPEARAMAAVRRGFPPPGASSARVADLMEGMHRGARPA